MAKSDSSEKLDLSDKAEGYRWKLPVLPNNAHLARDQLQCRLDFYEDTTVLFTLEGESVQTRVVSARDITMALLSDIELSSGVLPENTVFWSQSKHGVKVALWRPPQVWRVALMLEVFEQPKRFKIPMPGLLFVCEPGQPPYVYAAKKRPINKKDMLYHAPVYNVFAGGSSCQGTHKYPNKISQIPESFFRSFFSQAGNSQQRSKKYPMDLLQLWEELDGKRKYPMSDLVEFAPLEAIMK